MFWEILMILLLLLANGVFAMAEIAVVSSRKARLQKRADAGDQGAKEALALANAPNDFLSTVQVGITLVGVLAGAFGGATLSERLGTWLNTLSWVAPHGEKLAFALVVTLITYLSLIIGELVPKRLALNNPEQIASMVARPMTTLARMASPVVAFLTWSTEVGLKTIGLRPSEEPVVSEDEVRGLIEQGLGAGVFHQKERDMVEGVFRLDRQMVGELMTPASRIVWLNMDDPDEVSWRAIVASGHSQLPVYKGSRDNVVGVVSVKALWANLSLTGKVSLQYVLSQPIIVPESLLAHRLVDTFRQGGQHFALVADEFGMVQGLITLHDIVEAIVGDLPDKGQRNRPGARKREDGAWVVDAAMDIAEARKLIGIKRFPGEETAEYLSLGGFLIFQLEHIPEEGERVVSIGHVFEVLEVDRQRIVKVLISKLGTGHAHANANP